MFSIIIPTLNEEHVLFENTLFFKKIKDKLSAEIIVVDGGSDDATTHVAENFSCKVLKSYPSRSNQQNIGAEYATGDFLIFMHADTIISDEAIECIKMLKKILYGDSLR
jgi:glycosyltransferase involved in cell wall biosynthesis